MTFTGVTDLTNDLTPSMLVSLINWLWEMDFKVARANVKKWRVQNNLPEEPKKN